jgi:hypothetical protein
MAGPHKIILLALGVATLVGLSQIRMMRSGSVHDRLGTFTREGQPRRFKRYLYGNWIILALCLLAILWALISPETFDR